MIRPSELKIREEFNNCPGRDVIMQDWEKYGFDSICEFVDVDELRFWENAPDKIVFEFRGNVADALNLAMLMSPWQPDEFHHITREGKTIIRLWWD